MDDGRVLYRAMVTRNESTGEIVKVGNHTFLEGFSVQEVQDLLDKGYYVVAGIVYDESDVPPASEGCHGC